MTLYPLPPSSPFNSILDERSHSIAIFAFFFRYFSSTRPNEFFQIQAYLIHWFRLLALLFSCAPSPPAQQGLSQTAGRQIKSGAAARPGQSRRRAKGSRAPALGGTSMLMANITETLHEFRETLRMLSVSAPLGT